jgi:hypothetical protein
MRSSARAPSSKFCKGDFGYFLELKDAVKVREYLVPYITTVEKIGPRRSDHLTPLFAKERELSGSSGTVAWDDLVQAVYKHSHSRGFLASEVLLPWK